MKENPFVLVRKQRIQRIKEMIRENQPIQNSRLMALVAIEIGTTEKTTQAMLRALFDAGFIEWEGAVGGKGTWSIKEAPSNEPSVHSN